MVATRRAEEAHMMRLREPSSPLTPMKVTIWCTGKRKHDEDKDCKQKLAEMDVDEFVGVVRIKCPKCDTVVEFR